MMRWCLEGGGGGGATTLPTLGTVWLSDTVCRGVIIKYKAAPEGSCEDSLQFKRLVVEPGMVHDIMT